MTWIGKPEARPSDTVLETPPQWYALWTHSHCEQLVHDQLVSNRLCAFLPKVAVWSRRGGVRQWRQAPMFPGYLFLRQSMDKSVYIGLCRTRGLARVLGGRWDRLAVIPDEEIEDIRRVAEARSTVFPYPYLKEGQRVRIARGPLEGIEGILVESRSSKGLLVLSVNLLQRSVAVVVDCTNVVRS